MKLSIHLKSALGLLGLWALLAACVPASASNHQSLPTSLPVAITQPAALPTSTTQATNTSVVPSVTATPIPSAAPLPAQPTVTQGVTSTPTLGPDDWQDLPVVPGSISKRTQAIYLAGQALGNDPQAFSKVGDCGSTPAWFLGDFDRGSQYYRLGDYQDLQAVIDYFQGSYARTSLAARSGMNASSAFVPLWADPKFCNPRELPIECEYRVHRPSFVFIMLGTNDVWHPDSFEPQMRRILDYYIAQGVIPILSTKADNLEGDGSLNATIARLALEYQVPLWNYWRAAQELPDQGLQEDGAHLTFGKSYFDDPQEMRRGWTLRNLTALQVLDAVWKGVNASGN
jgi:hypothetical protein